MQNKKRIALVALGVVTCAVIAFVALVMTSTIVLFHGGFTFSGAEHVRLAVKRDELGKLDLLRSLQSIDFVGDSDYDAAKEWAAAHPNIQASFTVDVPFGVSYDRGSGQVDLSSRSEADALDLAAKRLQYADKLEGIRVDASSWSAEGLNQLHELCPTAIIYGTYTAGSLQVPLESTDLDLTNASAEDVTLLAEVAPCMVGLQHANLGQEQGHAKLAVASKLRAANPNTQVDYVFSAYNIWLNVNDTYLNFRQVPVGDNGDEIRDILASMPQVEVLDMDNTGVDNEHMAAIRDDFPNVNVIWRVWFGPNDVYTARTDAEKILASAEMYGWISPENSGQLNYCTHVKYLDLGHNSSLQNISFVENMPDLEVFVCSLCALSDISPISNCPHLEYFEAFGNNIYDLSPLANCHELKHLNVVNNGGISDITCLYDLDLERLWLGGYNGIPGDQIATYMANHPNCVVRTAVSNPHDGYRWGNPRYELLDQQLGYTAQDYQLVKFDTLLEPRTDIPWVDAPAPAEAEGEGPAEEGAAEPAEEPAAEETPDGGEGEQEPEAV